MQSTAEYAGMYYGADHPMKPPRIAMTHDLVLGYGLHEYLDVYVRFDVSLLFLHRYIHTYTLLN